VSQPPAPAATVARHPDSGRNFLHIGGFAVFAGPARPNPAGRGALGGRLKENF
jgi:hypothetical protein